MNKPKLLIVADTGYPNGLIEAICKTLRHDKLDLQVIPVESFVETIPPRGFEFPDPCPDEFNYGLGEDHSSPTPEARGAMLRKLHGAEPWRKRGRRGQ